MRCCQSKVCTNQNLKKIVSIWYHQRASHVDTQLIPSLSASCPFNFFTVFAPFCTMHHVPYVRIEARNISQTKNAFFPEWHVKATAPSGLSIQKCNCTAMLLTTSKKDTRKLFKIAKKIKRYSNIGSAPFRTKCANRTVSAGSELHKSKREMKQSSTRCLPGLAGSIQSAAFVFSTTLKPSTKSIFQVVSHVTHIIRSHHNATLNFMVIKSHWDLYLWWIFYQCGGECVTKWKILLYKNLEKIHHEGAASTKLFSECISCPPP